MTWTRLRRAGAVTLALTGALATSSAATADHADATIHPGVQTSTAGAQCTADFILTGGTDVFIGQAAHCSGTGGSTGTNGCPAGSLPIGTPVEVGGATKSGTLAYNSWLAVRHADETDANACQHNDFALVRLDPADHGRVSADVPVLGGPQGIDRDGVGTGERVYSYGNSSLRAGISQLSPKEGVSLGTTVGGWNHPVHTVTPGVPGDSGSAFLDADGQALGGLSTLALAPLAGSNGVSDLGKALDFARAATGEDYRLLEGTTAPDGELALVGVLLG